MKLFFFTFLVSILSISALAQNIRGKVIDESGEGVPGALLEIKETRLKTAADKNGVFLFDNLKSGIYNLYIKCQGYEDTYQKVKISDENVEIDIMIKTIDFSIEEVIVSAIGAGTNTPVAYLNIDKAEIKKYNNGQDIPFIIENSPSMVVTSDAGAGIGYTSLRIRGADMTRINITVDGIPINDAESHGVWWVNMPDFCSSVESIQIQRGVGTSTNGSGAFGANINLQTTKLNKKAFTEINYIGGSFNTHKESFKASTGLLNNKFVFDARLSAIHSDGYIDRAESMLNSMFISGTYIDLKNLLKVNFIKGHEETYQAWMGVPKDSLKTNRTFNPYTYKNEIDYYTQSHVQLIYKRKFTESLNLDIAFHYTLGEGYYEQYKEDEELKDYELNNVIISEDTIKTTDLIRRKWLDNDFTGTTYSFNFQKNKISITAGGSWNLYTGNHFGNIIWAEFASTVEPEHEWYRNKGIKKDFNNYFKINWFALKNVNIWSDIQYRNVVYSINGNHDDLRNISQNHSYPFINPKVGISYQINDKSSSYLSFAVANREPSRSNLRDAAENEVFFPETLYDFEAGIKHFSNTSAFELNLYYMNYNNQLILTGEINDVGAYIMSNVPESYRSGVELSGTIKLFKILEWEANVAFSKNIIKNLTVYIDNWDTWEQETEFYEETVISFSPSIVAGSDLSFHIFKGFDAGIVSKYVGKQFIDNTSNNERILNPYFVNNLRISYILQTKSIKEIGFNLFINNVLNELYESNAWVYRYYYEGEHYVLDGYFPQAGIHFLAGISLKF